MTLVTNGMGLINCEDSVECGPMLGIEGAKWFICSMLVPNSGACHKEQFGVPVPTTVTINWHKTTLITNMFLVSKKERNSESGVPYFNIQNIAPK